MPVASFSCSAKRAFEDAEVSAVAVQHGKAEIAALKSQLTTAEAEIARQSRAVIRSNAERRSVQGLRQEL